MATAKILLIGDELDMLRILRRNLFSRGYEVALAFDDQETMQAVSRTQFDLHVLDLDLKTPGTHGLAICRELRRRSQAPIIVLSALGSDKMKIEALDLGADDYLVMPFSMGEFLARVRSALRRWSSYSSGGAGQNDLILVRELLIDAETRKVTVRGEELHLTPKEYDLLLYLARRQGKVITHGELLHAIWGPEYGDEREYLRVFVSQIRRKIEDDPLRPVYILTEPGIGYRFSGEEGRKPEVLERKTRPRCLDAS